MNALNEDIRVLAGSEYNTAFVTDWRRCGPAGSKRGRVR